MSHPRPFRSIENRWRIVTAFLLWAASYMGVRLILDATMQGKLRPRTIPVRSA